MCQPVPALLLTLLVGTAAAAQPFPPARTPQRRSVTLPETPRAPAPVVYVAPGVLTTLVFPTPLERSSVVLAEQEAHFALVDVGDRTLTLEPQGKWGAQKRLELQARLLDGTLVTLVLVSHPSQVDGRVNVERPRPAASSQAEVDPKDQELAALKARCGVNGPASMVRQGLLDFTGVQAVAFQGKEPADNPSGLKLTKGIGYRGNQWALVELWLHNLPGQKPWTPGRARLIGVDGREVPVLAVHLDAPLQPGERARVVVDAQRPPDDAGRVFRLELSDSSGERLLSIQEVEI